MPELPEVQTTVDGINIRMKGLRIADIWTDYSSERYASKQEIKNRRYFPKFKKGVIGATVRKAERRGKNILISLSNGSIMLIHMKMTGHVLFGNYRKTARKKDPWEPKEERGALHDPFNRHIHFVITFSNGKHLALSDMRKFAKITLLSDTKNVPELSALGPDPLSKEFTSALMKERLQRRPNAPVKQALMDQTLISGIGNIYSDEILFASDIHPLSKVSSLTTEDFRKLFRNTKSILTQGIDFGGDSTSDYRDIDGGRGSFQYHHRAYRETKKPCSKRGCNGTIQRITLAGRGTHFCPAHQTLR